MTDTQAPRLRILATAAKLTGGTRDKTYGDPFINMTNTASIIGGYLQARGLIDNPADLTAEDAAMILVCVKISRTCHRGLPHEDNYVDAAAYLAMAGECAEAEREVEALTEVQRNRLRNGVTGEAEGTGPMSRAKLEFLTHPRERHVWAIPGAGIIPACIHCGIRPHNIRTREDAVCSAAAGRERQPSMDEAKTGPRREHQFGMDETCKFCGSYGPLSATRYCDGEA
jgi:hypothetical protein